MRIIAILTFISLSALQSGCAGIYDGLRTQQEMECIKRPGADQADCLRRSEMSYDEYQRQLKEREKEK